MVLYKYNTDLKETGSYRNIIKATTLFGGLQIFKVLLNLARGKIIAVLLGATGMGLNTMLASTLTMVNNISALGLNYSAVRDISKSKESGDINKFSSILIIFRRLLYGTASLGFVAVFMLARLLSRYTFQSNDYTKSFMLLAIVLFFNTLALGNASILQGTRDLKGFALQALTGSAVSLIISVPMYLLWGIEAIVPTIIVTSLITYIFSIYYSSKVKIKRVEVSRSETYEKGKEMIKLGVVMMMTTSATSLAYYLINTYISRSGSLADLGLYQAGMSIVTQSIGMVFTAMAVDYYPRLAAISNENHKVRSMVNQQGEVTMLIASPLLIALIIASPIVISILLSHEFAGIVTFLRTLAFGVFFKAASYSIGAISFAKGDKKTFFFLECIYVNVSLFAFCVGGYIINGLEGLAWAFLVMHFVYFVIVNIVNHRLYDFSIDIDLRRIFLVQLLFVCIAFAALLLLKPILGYPIASISLILSAIFSFRNIDRLIGFKDFIRTFLLRKGKKEEIVNEIDNQLTSV